MAKEFSYEQLRNALKILKLPADFNNSVLRAHADYANEQAREKAATEAEPEPHQPAAMLPHPSASVLPNIPAAMLPHPSVAVLPNLIPPAMLPHPSVAVLPNLPAAMLQYPSAAVLPNPPNNCQQGNIQPGFSIQIFSLRNMLFLKIPRVWFNFSQSMFCHRPNPAMLTHYYPPHVGLAGPSQPTQYRLQVPLNGEIENMVTIPFCKCRLRAREIICKKIGPNLGRPMYKCPQFQCDAFYWKDERQWMK